MPSSGDTYQAVSRFIEKMPPVPLVLGKIMEVTAKPDVSATDLGNVISLDPVLTGKVLRLVNSAHSGLPTTVTSIMRAIILLGMNTIKNLAISSAVLGSVGNRSFFKALNADEFWEHSVGVGITARRLAQRIGISRSQQEEFFVAGLLHDIGKIVLNAALAEPYVRVLKSASETQEPLHCCEQAEFGLTHCDIGARLAEQWQLPGPLRGALEHHHSLTELNELAEFERNLIYLVAMADTFCNQRQQQPTADNLDSAIAFDQLCAFPAVSLAELHAESDSIDLEIAQAKAFLLQK